MQMTGTTCKKNLLFTIGQRIHNISGSYLKEPNPGHIREDDHEDKDDNQPFVETGMTNATADVHTIRTMVFFAYPTRMISEAILMMNAWGAGHTIIWFFSSKKHNPSSVVPKIILECTDISSIRLL